MGGFSYQGGGFMKTDKWIDEFDSKFTLPSERGKKFIGYLISEQELINRIKSFIRTLLAEQKKEIEEKMNLNFAVGERADKEERENRKIQKKKKMRKGDKVKVIQCDCTHWPLEHNGELGTYDGKTNSGNYYVWLKYGRCIAKKIQKRKEVKK